MMIYLSNWRPGEDSRVLSLRTAGDPMRTVTAVRREVLALDPAVPVLNARTISAALRCCSPRLDYTASSRTR